MNSGDKVRVVGGGNAVYEVGDKSSPLGRGEWIIRRPSGSMRSVHPSRLVLVKKK
jgi:hypothetical protein